MTDDIASIAGSVSTAVSSVSSIITTLGGNDMNKAIRAAKQAGRYAKNLEGKKYPSWDVKGTKELAQEMGISTRSAWKKARAEAMDNASDEAYNEVMALYKAQVEAGINIAETTSSQEYLDASLAKAQAEANTAMAKVSVTSNKVGGAGVGCVVVLLGLVCGVTSFVYCFVSFIC